MDRIDYRSVVRMSKEYSKEETNKPLKERSFLIKIMDKIFGFMLFVPNSLAFWGAAMADNVYLGFFLAILGIMYVPFFFFCVHIYNVNCKKHNNQQEFKWGR